MTRWRRPLFVMNHGTEGSSQHVNEPPPSAGDPGCPFASQCMRFLTSNDLRTVRARARGAVSVITRTFYSETQ